MDPLQEIPSNDWSTLRDLYGTLWPDGAAAYCILDNYIKHPGLKEVFNFKVYCPGGDMKHGMLATSVQSGFYHVVIQPFGEPTTKLEEALLTTTQIDWNQNILVPCINDKGVECLENVKDVLGIKLCYDYKSKPHKLILNKESPKFDIILPQNTYIGPLTPEHLDLVDNTWTYHTEESNSFFEILMKNNLTFVLYSLETKQPMTWVVVDSYGGLKHLFCLEEHRRKGYAEVVTKYAINYLLSKGQNAICHVSEKNKGSMSLVMKLGFQNIGYDNWVFIPKAKK